MSEEDQQQNDIPEVEDYVQEFDISNPADVKAKKKTAKSLDAVRDEGLRYILNNASARSYINELLARCKMFHTIFHPNVANMAHNEGQRHIGLSIYTDIARVDVNKIIVLMNELKAEDIQFNQSQKRR